MAPSVFGILIYQYNNTNTYISYIGYVVDTAVRPYPCFRANLIPKACDHSVAKRDVRETWPRVRAWPPRRASRQILQPGEGLTGRVRGTSTRPQGPVGREDAWACASRGCGITAKRGPTAQRSISSSTSRAAWHGPSSKDEPKQRSAFNIFNERSALSSHHMFICGYPQPRSGDLHKPLGPATLRKLTDSQSPAFNRPFVFSHESGSKRFYCE